MTLLRLSEKGLQTFREQYDDFRNNPQYVAQALLNQTEFHEPVPEHYDFSDISLEFQREFTDRRDLGEYLYEQFGDKKLLISNDKGLWAWLSLKFLHQILQDPSKNTNTSKIGHIERWIQSDSESKMSRQLLYGPYSVCVDYPTEAHRGVRALLLGGQGLASPGDTFESLYGGRTLFAQNPQILPALAALYLNDQRKRKGIQAGPGSTRRLGKFLNQLSKTYYLNELSADFLLERLPNEYERWNAS